MEIAIFFFNAGIVIIWSIIMLVLGIVIAEHKHDIQKSKSILNS